ncbi:MAG: hypothetical protein AAGB22_13740, partial [Bacteroidota bacterium]
HIQHRPDIMDANKKDLVPQALDSIPPAPVSDYQVIQKQMATDFEVDTIKAARLKGEGIRSLDRLYVKGGLGTFMTTMLDARYHTLQSRTHSLGVDFSHFASSGQVKDRGPSDISRNNLMVYGRKFIKKHVLGADFEVDRDVVHYFGYDPDLVNFTLPELEEEDIRQKFVRIGGELSAKSFYKDSARTNHDIRLNFYRLTDDFRVSENTFKASAYLKHYYNNELFTLRADVDYNNMEYSTRQVNNNYIIRAAPGVVARGKKWRLNLGVGVAIDAGKDEFAGNDDTKFHFYPNAYFNYRMVGDVIIPYVGVSGSLERNNLRSLTDENPFLLTDVALRNVNTKYKFYGGIRGGYSASTSFKLEASLSRVEDMPLFVNNNLSDPNYAATIPQQVADLQFGVIYDTVDVVNISAEV